MKLTDYGLWVEIWSHHKMSLIHYYDKSQITEVSGWRLENTLSHQEFSYSLSNLKNCRLVYKRGGSILKTIDLD